MSNPTTSVEWFVVLVAGIAGLLVGSFLNVVIYRAPLGLSVSTPRSYCPTCDRTLSWWENVPVLSWVALRGRCRTCHQPISVRYPIVELTTGGAFAMVAWAWHGDALTAGYCVLAATAIAGALIEFGGNRTPLSVGAIGAGAGALLIVGAALWLGRDAVAGWSVIGLVVGAASFGVLRGTDPGCRDPRWHGRALLPAAGCWLGGLGPLSASAVVAGAAAWVLAAFACLVVLWAAARRAVRTGPGGNDGGHQGSPMPPVAATPLVTGMVVAMAVSLIVAG
jgi:leader peptidase (prepilin peptidase) / N-methyltransferase